VVTTDRPRAVVLVGNPVNPYSRAIRIGRTLVDAGYDVEIAATTEPGAPLEQRDGPLVIRRYAASGVFAGLASTYRWESPVAGRRPPLRTRVVRKLRLGPASWILWPHTVRGWWQGLATALAPADLYHACGVLAIAPALTARQRDRREGRSSVVVFDVIDITLRSNNVLGMPGVVRWLLGRRERRWAQAPDAHVTVNEDIADEAVARWSLARRPAVVPNYPEPWDAADGESPGHIRAATGLPTTTRICLFQGRLGPYVGLDEAAEAVLLVPNAALVVIGFGRGWEASVARDKDPRYAGRHFTLPAVHPDDLAAWVASADVALCTLPPLSFNQRHATPNKFFEAMAAGTPIVIGPDLPVMEAILRREDAGVVARSMAPVDIAAALTEIVDRPAPELLAWRRRIQAAARERYSWPVAAKAYRAALDDLRFAGPP
jgi:glycosyltransferase involved in cell wall biosynthesis